MSDNTFTKSYADGVALFAADLDTAAKSVQPHKDNLALATTGSTAGQFLKSTGSGLAPSWGSPADLVGIGSNRNYALAAVASSNTLIASLKSAAGTDASATDPVDLYFSSYAATSSVPTNVQVTAALSITIPNGATLGLTSGSDCLLYVYAINVSGSVRLAVSARSDFDDGRSKSVTQISGSATVATNIYCPATTSSGTYVCRLLGHILATHTAGAWATVPTKVGLLPGQKAYVSAPAGTVLTGNGHTTTTSMQDLNVVVQQYLTASSANFIGTTMTAAGVNAVLADVTSCTATVANLIGTAMTAAGVNAVLADVTSCTSTVANLIGTAMTAAGVNAVLADVTSCTATVANLIGTAMTSTGVNAVLADVTSCTATVANLIGTAMTASGANAVLADVSSFPATQANLAAAAMTTTGVTSILTTGGIGSESHSIPAIADFPTSSGNYADMTSLTLAAGTYDLCGIVMFQQNGSSGSSYIEALINATSGNVTTGATFGVDWLSTTAVPNSLADSGVVIPRVRVSPAISTTYYLKGKTNFSGGTPRYRGILSAVKVGV